MTRHRAGKSGASSIRCNCRKNSQGLVGFLGAQDRVEELAGTTFNSCLLNFYRSGVDHMGYHSDNEPLYGSQPIIGEPTCNKLNSKLICWLRGTAFPSFACIRSSSSVVPALVQGLCPLELPGILCCVQTMTIV